MENKARGEQFDLGAYMGKRVEIKFAGGRVVQGVLAGYDKLFNLVLGAPVTELQSGGDGEDEAATEDAEPRVLTDAEAPYVVCRGSQVMVITPTDGYEEIENPWLAAANA